MSELRAQLQRALGAAYTIERELGGGGMSRVFVACDESLGRDVVIKVLSPELSATLSAERFTREIKLAASLQEPHIVPVLAAGQTAEGLPWYSMPFVRGDSLRARLSAGRMSVAECAGILRNVAQALSYAHGQGLVHRDIKPENVLLSSGTAVVTDFGIAKALAASKTQAPGGTITQVGTSLGTPAYMAPEQITGDDVDARADLYAWGVMAYEMLAGRHPFSERTTSQQLLAAHLAEAPKSLVDAATAEERRDAALLRVAPVVMACLEKQPSARPASAGALLHELRLLAAPPAAGAGARSRPALVAGGVAFLAIAVLAVLFVRDRRARWAHETALPAIARLAEADELDSAFTLAAEAAARVPGDSAVLAAWDALSLSQVFLSEPAGATVTRAPVNDTTRWLEVGTTPTDKVRIPRNAWFYRYTKPGYRAVTIMGARLGGSYVPIPSPVPLRRFTDPDSDMVLLRGGRLVSTLYGIATGDTFDLSDFLMDKLEVTNRQYKAFVDAGGYSNARWWDATIMRDGRPARWEEVVRSFTDRTGRPGPSTWEGGAPAEGADDLPVGGLSWHEARAYALYAGKALPTVIEWNAAAIPEAARWVVPHGRYESATPVRGGAARGVSPRGVYDMAGNMREWTVNAREPGSRYILGGGYTDPPYLFSEIYTQPELDRSAINGIRLVRRVGIATDLARASAPLPGPTRSSQIARPVDDATYRGYLSMYDYDHTPLNATIVARDTTPADWVREDVEFDVPGSAMRMWAVLFLPKRVRAPYQTVVLWPASDAFILRDRRNLSMTFVDYIARSGRAVLYPIYEHTYGRGSSLTGDRVSATIEHRDQMLRWAREMRRSIDYAATRADIDTTRLAYVGTSWGARLAGVMLAVEPRFRAAVLNVAGLGAAPKRPEEDPVNFLPRVRIPVLMLSGRYDSVFPFELSQKPFLQLLGSPEKKQILFDGGHFLPRTMMVSESLKWLDQYLGPVARP